MSLSRLADYSFIVTLSFEVPLFAALDNAILEIGVLAPQLSFAKGPSNYTTIELINKGNDGLGTDVLASITTNSADPNAIDLVTFIPTTLFVNKTVTKGDVIACKKTDVGGAVNLGFCSFSINERRY